MVIIAVIYSKISHLNMQQTFVSTLPFINQWHIFPDIFYVFYKKTHTHAICHANTNTHIYKSFFFFEPDRPNSIWPQRRKLNVTHIRDMEQANELEMGSNKLLRLVDIAIQSLKEGHSIFRL